MTKFTIHCDYIKSVDSSNIESVAYSSSSRTAYVTFKGGSLYAYTGIDSTTVQRLINAPSVGKFLNSSIKPYYNASQLKDYKLSDKKELDAVVTDVTTRTLGDIFDCQRNLEERINGPINQLKWQERCYKVVRQYADVSMELSEMISEIPHKYWKKSYTSEQLDGFVDKEHREHVLEEYVDALHFFVNMGLYLGFNGSEVTNKYFAKNKVNHERQDNGY